MKIIKCPRCGSDNFDIISGTILKCKACGVVFDLTEDIMQSPEEEDDPDFEEVKPKKEEEPDSHPNPLHLKPENAQICPNCENMVPKGNYTCPLCGCRTKRGDKYVHTIYLIFGVTILSIVIMFLIRFS